MKLIIYLLLILSIGLVGAQVEQQQQRILRRVIKSTPTASNLGRVRLVTVRSASGSERGAVSELTSKEAATFGLRSANETIPQSAPAAASGGLKSKSAIQTPAPAPAPAPESTPTPTAAPTAAPTSSTTSSSSSAADSGSSAAPTEVSAVAKPKQRASERQQQAAEVELLSSAPSSWQTMSAVEAPASMLIASGTRAAIASTSSDLSSSSSSNSEEYSSTGDFLRSNSIKGGGSSLTRQTSARQQQQQQQPFFYPQQQQQSAPSKTSNYQASKKTNWYQPPTSPRPAPIIQQQLEQQSEQYVEQQQEYASAPLGQAEPFAFDFKTEDNSGNGQYRREESDKNGVVRGSYGYTDANGIYRHVDYVADHNGFRANIKSNEPGLIGETQPASIQYPNGPAPAQPNNNNQRYTAAADNGADWSSQGSSGSPVSGAALAPPDFESSHRSDRIRAPRNLRN